MPLQETLAACRAAALGRWREQILEGQAATAPPRLGKRDPLHDPVGAALQRATAALYDHLCGAVPESEAHVGLEELIRIRSVQELMPSQAVGFVFLLRPVLREAVPEGAGAPEEWRRLDGRIDALAGAAFDLFVACRQEVFALRTREGLSASYLLLRRAGLLQPGAGTAAPERQPGGGDP